MQHDCFIQAHNTYGIELNRVFRPIEIAVTADKNAGIIFLPIQLNMQYERFQKYKQPAK